MYRKAVHTCIFLRGDNMTVTSEQLHEVCSDQTLSAEIRMRKLREMRAELLSKIHEKQRLLDQIDYMIVQLKKEDQI